MTKTFIFPAFEITIRSNSFRLLKDLCLLIPSYPWPNVDKHLKVSIDITVSKCHFPFGRNDQFNTSDNSRFLNTWTKDVSVKIMPAVNKIEALLVYPCGLPLQAILHLTVLEPLRELLKHHNNYWLHAACVAKNDLGLLLFGPPASGKSTMSALLLDKGFSFLSDEFVMFKNRRLYALPISIHLDKRSQQTAQKTRHNFDLSRTGRDFFKVGKNILLPECRPFISVFLTPAKTSVKVEPLDLKKSLYILLSDIYNSFLFEKKPGLRKGQISTLAFLAEKTMPFRLSFRLSDFERAAQAIKKLFDKF